LADALTTGRIASRGRHQAWPWGFGLLATLTGLGPLAADALAAGCAVPPAAVAGLKWASENPDAYTSHLLRGDVYLRAGCLDEADAEFIKTREVLVDRPAGEERDKLEQGAIGSRELVAALRTLRRGEMTEARRALAAILDRYVHTRLLLMTTLTLADLGRQMTLDPRESEVLEGSLRKLAENGYWQADAYLVDRRLVAGEGARILDELEERLQAELPVLRRIALQVTYADALFKLGRLLEAQLLLAEVEDEVAEKVVDSELRIQYLKLCLEVWQTRARRGHDPGAQERVEAFASALLQLRAIAAGESR